MSVSATDHSGTLLTVVVNNSTGGAGGWFGIFSPVLEDPTSYETIGMSTSFYWYGRVKSPAEVDYFILSSLNISKSVLWSIVIFLRC